jgi:hypothetical protein
MYSEPNNCDNKRSITRILTVDSKFKDDDKNKTTSHFQVSFPERINEVNKMELTEYSGPSAIRMISTKQQNNFFTLTLKYPGATSDAKIVIKSPDTYRIERHIMTSETVIRFINNINAQLTAAGNDFQYGSFKFNHDILADVSLNDIIMDRTISFVFDITELTNQLLFPEKVILDFVSPEAGTVPLVFEKSLGYILGFRNHRVLSSVLLNNKYHIRAESIVDLNDFKYAYLIVDDFISNSETNIITSEIKSKGNCSGSLRHGGNILGKIIYRNELNYNMYNRVISTPREYYGNVDIQKLKISLVNEYGDYIDTQQLDWSFTLRLTSVV